MHHSPSRSLTTVNVEKLWFMRLSGLLSVLLVIVVLSPSLQSFPPAGKPGSHQILLSPSIPNLPASFLLQKSPSLPQCRSLLPHRSQRLQPFISQRGDREMEECKVQGGDREVDGGSEEGEDLRAGVFASVLACFRGWNQHGLGGDNVKGSCRDLHPGPVSLLHWSGSRKPWFRLDSRRPCPL
ncbi:hypothetical protein HA466_0098010 [Hirschfeldia incana]|nr:hypothetical protein HA466_0098010 [Hirschfeldia incana]